MNIKRPIILSISVTILLVLAAIVLVYYFSKSSGPIVDFDEQRDTQEILKIFNRDRYWLTTSQDYSPEFMLKYHAPNQSLQYMGQLKIKVWWEQHKFVGFTAYYMEKPQVGILLFIDVNPEFRGKEKKYAQRLVQYVINALRKMGAQRVQLVTRTDNLPAQGLYRRVGFYETSRDNVLVYFQYDV